MKIVDLRDGMRRIDVEGMITDVPQETRTVNLRTGGEARVKMVRFEDGSGAIPLALWDDQIDRVKKGSKVKVVNGYTNSYRGEVQLQVGKYGQLEVQS
jgi:replication factor A1